MQQFNLPNLSIKDGKVYINDVLTEVHRKTGNFRLMSLINIEALGEVAVMEALSDDGAILYQDKNGKVLYQFERRLESTKPNNESSYLGYQKHVITRSNADIMGREVLLREEDPSYESIKNIIPPIRKMKAYDEFGELPHTFIGTRESNDVLPLYYTYDNVSRIHHAYVTDEIQQAIESCNVSEGLLGGYLPCVIFRFYIGDGAYWECTAFAKTHGQCESIQPAWYRYMKVKDGEIAEIHYYDSYLPYPLKEEPDPKGFYYDLYLMKEYWDEATKGGMEIDITKEAWVADFCKHSIVRDMICRNGYFPRYGFVVRAYGSPEHDGFQDVLTASVDCYLEWGRYDLVKAYIENYFDYYVRDNGQLEYRGPEMGQYARMLTEFAQYYAYTKDDSLALKYAGKVAAITKILLERRSEAKELPKDDPAYGMIKGHHEADIGFVHQKYKKLDFEQPYFSNSTEAVRAFRDLGYMWKKIGQSKNDEAIIQRGEALISEAQEFEHDLLASLKNSLLTERSSGFLPPIAGCKVYYYDYPYRSMPESFDDNRVWCEMMHSGVVPKEYVSMIMRDGMVHNGMKLGIFGNQGTDVAFLCYGEAYGLIQHDMIREFLMLYYTHALHMHTRGTWTTFECNDIDRDRGAGSGFVPPAQMTIPTITKWMLVFEDPMNDTLWLCKATPREWLADDEHISVKGAPTRYGSVDIHLESHIEEGYISGKLNLPEGSYKKILRLRLPGLFKITGLYVNERAITLQLQDSESIILPADVMGDINIRIDVNANL